MRSSPLSAALRPASPAPGRRDGGDRSRSASSPHGSRAPRRPDTGRRRQDDGTLRDAVAAGPADGTETMAMTLVSGPVDRHALTAEMDLARATFRQLLACADPAALRRRSTGTRWTNEQLLFHMLFGYLVVRALLRLVRTFGRLPDGASRVFAAGLDRASGPFNTVNYWGSVLGARVFPAARMADRLDRVVASLQLRLDRESDGGLQHGMHYPTRWDPFFQRYMTVADLYHYPTQHFEFHRRQLTL